jgi:hypothetical protein
MASQFCWCSGGENYRPSEIRSCVVLHFVKESGQPFRGLGGFLKGMHDTGAGAERAEHTSSITRIHMELLKRCVLSRARERLRSQRFFKGQNTSLSSE